MKNSSLLFASFFLVLALGALHYSAIFFYFYWTVWWFDILMHSLGGLSLGMFVLWCLRTAGVLGAGAPSRRKVFSSVLVSIAIIGVGWEIFEYAFDISSTEKNYALDTSMDLAADMLGGFVAAALGAGRKSYPLTETNG